MRKSIPRSKSCPTSRTRLASRRWRCRLTARTCLSGSCDTSIKLWEVATGRLLRTFVGHAQAITAVAFSPDGRRLLSSSRDSALKLWDAASGKLIRSWEGHRLAATAVAFSPDGTLLPSAGSDSIGRIDNTLRRTRGSFARLEDWCPPLSS